MIENRDVSEQRALSDKCGSYFSWSIYLFWIPIVKTPRKTKIILFPKKQNNVQAFVNSHIHPIVLFCRQYFRQEVFVRFYFLVKITAGNVSMNWLLQMVRAFTFCFCYQTTCYLYWLTECQTGTFWLTDRDAGTKPLKPGLSWLSNRTYDMPSYVQPKMLTEPKMMSLS